MSRHQNTEQNHNINIVNKYFENVINFKYLVQTVINQNYIHEEIKSKLNSGTACYGSVLNILSFPSEPKD
jgi:hypothetical protein